MVSIVSTREYIMAAVRIDFEGIFVKLPGLGHAPDTSKHRLRRLICRESNRAVTSPPNIQSKP